MWSSLGTTGFYYFIPLHCRGKYGTSLRLSDSWSLVICQFKAVFAQPITCKANAKDASRLWICARQLKATFASFAYSRETEFFSDSQQRYVTLCCVSLSALRFSWGRWEGNDIVAAYGRGNSQNCTRLRMTSSTLFITNDYFSYCCAHDKSRNLNLEICFVFGVNLKIWYIQKKTTGSSQTFRSVTKTPVF